MEEQLVTFEVARLAKEKGTWNHNRKQLIDIAGMFKSYDEYREVQDKYLEKYGGYAHETLFRPLPCLLIK